MTYLSKVNHICEHCGGLHSVYKSELKRGRGVYCCNDCRSHHSHDKSFKVMCEMCGAIFSTHLGRTTCSIECDEAKKSGKPTLFGKNFK